jgi:light-regulated signal transduction histidine kinase (bacteriophytochrome)
METVQELTAEPEHVDVGRVQSCSYLLELSLDWIVLRASENIHHLLGESHVTLIEEPLGRFVHAQALHDLRNLFSRLSAMTGIGRAYGIRLTDDPDLVDIAFQVNDGRVVLEAVRSCGNFGECFGSVGGLSDGLSEHGGQQLLEAGARRMRALTGYDQVSVTCGDMHAESSRGAIGFFAPLNGDLPVLIADCEAQSVSMYPRDPDESSIDVALTRAPDASLVDELRQAGVRSVLRVPFHGDSLSGEFRCGNRTPDAPNFEMHAAAELFAQLFAMRLEIGRLHQS